MHLAERRRRTGGIRVCLTAVAVVVVFAPPVAAERGQSLEVTAGMASYLDDNILRYSDQQISDLASRLHTYRYGVGQAEDLVFNPSLALLWKMDYGNERKRSLRVKGDGDLHRTNGVADFGALGVTWREGFTRGRRLSLSYYRSPDTYQRRLSDEDLASLPVAQRYRDASLDLQTAGASWRHPLPRAILLEVGYRFERRRYSADFRERDSDTHMSEIGLGWERLPRAGRFQLSTGYLNRNARGEDGLLVPAAAIDPDLSYHGMEVGLAGSMELGAVRGWQILGDLRYEAERRLFDSTRPADLSHFGRKDLAVALEAGMRLQIGESWWTRGFFRQERNRARYGTISPSTGSEIGGYTVNQFGIAVEWTREVWRRKADPGSMSSKPARGARDVRSPGGR